MSCSGHARAYSDTQSCGKQTHLDIMASKSVDELRMCFDVIIIGTRLIHFCFFSYR
jgi:hypothetical protein